VADDFLDGEEGDRVTLRGILSAEVVAVGSKSERRSPVLVVNAVDRYRLFLVGDNPFENSGLLAFVDTEVSLTGVWRNGTVRVEQDQLVVHSKESVDEPELPAAEKHAIEPLDE
jgi:hypothetical protein